LELPYAKGATRWLENIITEDVVYMLHGMEH
jgi:hypothetical protein